MTKLPKFGIACATFLLAVILIHAFGGSLESKNEGNAIPPNPGGNTNTLSANNCCYPFYAPPLTAKTVEDIHFDLMVSNRNGRLEFEQPLKRQFRYQNRDYLVAMDNDIIGDGGESYTHSWLYIYNLAFKEWRCFQISHFRNVSALDAELDAKKGQIVIKDVGNEYDQKMRGAVLTIFNLDATSDDAGYVHPQNGGSSPPPSPP